MDSSDSSRDIRALVMKSFVWNIWPGRNDYIFSATILPTHVIILKIDHMILSWFSAALEDSKVKLEDSISTIRHNLKFL